MNQFKTSILHYFIVGIATACILFFSQKVNAQTYSLDASIDATTISTCSGTFYDSGGSSSAYSNNENRTVTFCSAIPGQYPKLTFSSFNIENGYDFLTIYDGANISAPQIGSYSGNSPGTITASSSCLTVRFTSDNNQTVAGWTATVSCNATPGVNPCSCPNNIVTVSDNSFENGASGWVFSANATNATQAAYKICGNNYAWIIPNDGNPATITQQLNAAAGISAGRDFTFTFYAGTHDPSGDNKMRLEFFNASNVSLGLQEVQVDNDVDISGALQQYSLSMTAPTGTSYAKIIGTATGNGYLKVDQVCVSFPCNTIINPSANQISCAGVNGNNITVNTNKNTTNSIKFVRFTTDQMVGSSPTNAEAAAIYNGTTIAMVTPTGGSAPYTANYTWNSSDFPNVGSSAINYYVYAILADDANGICRPVQEIRVTVHPLPSFSLNVTNVNCFGAGNGTITINSLTGTSPFTYSIDNGVTFPNATGLFNSLVPNTYKPAIKDANGCVKRCQ